MNEYERILADVKAEQDKQAAEDKRARDIIKGAVKEALKETGHKPTKEEILKEPNQRKRQALIRDNMDLFK